MSNLESLKKKSKQLFNDWKSHSVIKDADGRDLLVYNSKYYDFKSFVNVFGLSHQEELDFKLMNAQHMIAQMARYKKWNDLIKADEEELYLARSLVSHFRTGDDLLIWLYYLEKSNYDGLSTKNKIEFFEEFCTEKIDYVSLIKERADDFGESIPVFSKEENVNGLYCYSSKLVSLMCKEYGKTEEEAKLNCERATFKFFECSDMLEYIEVPGLNAEEKLIELERWGFIKNLKSENVKRLTDKDGKVYYSCRYSCKRLMKNITFVGFGKTEEEAIISAAEKLVNFIVSNKNA